METLDVYLLTAEWQDDPSHRLIFYGKSPNRGPVELIFDQTQVLFFVEREEKLPALDFPFERKPLSLLSFSKQSLDGIYFRSQRELRTAADRFAAMGVRFYESDVRPNDRFLMERFIKGFATIRGEGQKKGLLTRFLNPKIKASPAHQPRLRVLSLDIETGVSSGQLYSIAVHLTGDDQNQKKVFMLADRRSDITPELGYYGNQKALLEAFLLWLGEADPDLIIGWHVIGFDLMFLERKCRDLGLKLALARSDRKAQLIEKPGSGFFATIAGRVVIDGPPALRSRGYRFANFKLETVAQELLKTGKLITPDQDKIAEIERQFRDDKPMLAQYNLEDCILVTNIFAETRLLEQMIDYSSFSGLLLDQSGLHNAALDHVLLPKLHRKGWAAPHPQTDEKALSECQPLPIKPGIYERVVVLELSQLQATLVHGFKIGPLSFARAEVNPIQTPTGDRFSATEQLLPEHFGDLLVLYRQCREPQERIRRQAITNYLKNLCKALNNPKSRFFHPHIGRAIDRLSSWLIRQSANFLETRGYPVILADGGRLFIQLPKRETQATPEALEDLCRQLQTFLEEKFSGINSALQLEIYPDKNFNSFLLPHSPEKAKTPCFAGTLAGSNTPHFMGFESLLSTKLELPEHLLLEFLSAFFKGEQPDRWLLDFLERLKSGAYDSRLIYRRRLKKDIGEYSKNPPPHIKAARLLPKPARSVHYLWTKRGPIPLELDPRDIDYEHYIQKHIQPLGDLVLRLLDKSFQGLTKPEQIELF